MPRVTLAACFRGLSPSNLTSQKYSASQDPASSTHSSLSDLAGLPRASQDYGKHSKKSSTLVVPARDIMSSSPVQATSWDPVRQKEKEMTRMHIILYHSVIEAALTLSCLTTLLIPRATGEGLANKVPYICHTFAREDLLYRLCTATFYGSFLTTLLIQCFIHSWPSVNTAQLINESYSLPGGKPFLWKLNLLSVGWGPVYCSVRGNNFAR